jgi:hypothetical protein
MVFAADRDHRPWKQELAGAILRDSGVTGGGGAMGPDEEAAFESREVQGEVELVNGEVFDVTASASLPHPGEEPAREPVEEILSGVDGQTQDDARRAHPGAHRVTDRRGRPGYRAWTARTGTGLCRTIVVASLPSRTRETPSRACDTTATRAAGSASAASTMGAHTSWPERIS